MSDGGAEMECQLMDLEIDDDDMGSLSAYGLLDFKSKTQDRDPRLNT